MAGTDHKTRLRIASCALETTAGTFNDDATGGIQDPANAALQVYVANTNFETNNDNFDREIAAKTYAKEPGLISRKTGTITVQAEARGAGGTVSGVVSFDLWLQACGMKRGSAESFAVSSDTPASPGDHENLNQAFAGMVITQAVSGETATFVYIDPHLEERAETPAVDSECIVYNVTGTPTVNNEWTGTGIDGTTVVTIRPNGSAPTPYGNIYYFDTPMQSGSPLADDRYSVALWNPYTTTTSTRHKLTGSVGNFNMSGGNVGEPVFMNFALQGKILAADGQDDATTPVNIPFETTTPPTFSGVDATVHNRSTVVTSPATIEDWESDVCFNTFDIDFNNDIQLDECATATGGVKKVDINGRAPTGNINPRLLEEAVHAYFDDWDFQDDMIMRMKLGTTLGNRVEWIVPRARFTTFGLADVNGNTVVAFPFGLYTPKADPGDNDFYLITR